MHGLKCVYIVSLLLAAAAIPARASDTNVARPTGRLYLDVGYLRSSTQPANNTWRSKGTTSFLDRLKINNATLIFQKDVAPESRLGLVAGVQAGIDVDGLAPSNAVSDAETLKHLYYTNVKYLFAAGRGLKVAGGLIPGHMGMESFHAIDNPTYTRVYGVDNVPYFNWGVQATYPFDSPLSASLLVINGYDYLASPNSVPSYGLQLTWKKPKVAGVRQNFYYGPDQGDTALEYWRFVSNTIGVWKVSDIELGVSVGYGNEKQADVVSNNHYEWGWGAFWLVWQASDSWSVAARPEFFRDPDGLLSGARQTIHAITSTIEYRLSPLEMNTLSARLEYRFDRSTGPEGGFFEGADNRLVRDQHLVIASVMLFFDTASRRDIGSRPGPRDEETD